MVSTIQNLGVRSEHAYAAGFASIGLVVDVLPWALKPLL